jgi:Zn finger protein HypA/HybF involved in hydrogenase expression
MEVSMSKQRTPFQCCECGKRFKKKLGKNTVEVKCPGCQGYDVEII